LRSADFFEIQWADSKFFELMSAKKSDKNTIKPKKYRSPESRARQLAGLSGVRISDHVEGCDHVQKINGKGDWASVSEEQRKQILELYSKGQTITAIAERLNLSKTVVGDVKLRALDTDTQFANAMFRVNIRQKLQNVAELSADKVSELIPEMNARDATLALSKAMEALGQMEADKMPDIQVNNFHLHASDIQRQFLAAMNDSEETTKTIDI
jgi:hypothetical protein